MRPVGVAADVAAVVKVALNEAAAVVVAVDEVIAAADVVFDDDIENIRKFYMSWKIA